jgi:hypothetical protein
MKQVVEIQVAILCLHIISKHISNQNPEYQKFPSEEITHASSPISLATTQ